MKHGTRSAAQATGGGPGPRGSLRLMVVAMVSVVASFGMSTSAHAHTELVSSTPAQGDTVPLQLDRVVLTFSTDLMAAGAAIVVRDPRGREVIDDIGNLGDTVDAQLTLETPGRHTLTYRVVGQDGHAIVGGFSFTAVANSASEPAVVSAGPPQSGEVTRRAEAASHATSASSTPWSLTWWPVWTTAVVGVLILLIHTGWRRRQRARI